MERNEFASLHPAVSFAYFIAVLSFSMLFTHPVMLAVSLFAAVGYSVSISGRKTRRFYLIYMLPVCLFTMALNPIFSHEGATILRWLPDGNPLTLESIFFGIAAAAMMITVIAWFSCVNRVLMSDKFVWLLGRIMPSLSLLLSMALRFIPRFNARLKAVFKARKSEGRQTRGIWKKAKNAMASVSAVTTWALENAIETADSMKSRGYGLPGRTAFSIYRFEKRDCAALIFIIACTVYIICGAALGGIYWQYYPVTTGSISSPYSISIFIVYFALCAMPIYINGKENLTWKYSVSKI